MNPERISTSLLSSQPGVACKPCSRPHIDLTFVVMWKANLLGGDNMNDLERFRGTLQYGKVDRAPFYEFMWPAWAETAERWAKEGGYVAGKTDFGCDKWAVESSWFWPQPPFAREILVEDEEYATYVDPQGIVMR